MSSIGVAELLILSLIAVLLLGAPLAVLVWLVARSRAAPAAPPAQAPPRSDL